VNREEVMPGTTVTREQFKILDGAIIHQPTGAIFSFYPDRLEFSTVSWGAVGVVLSNGDDYRQAEVQEMATQLLREQDA
jgi:hypothetical protein